MTTRKTKPMPYKSQSTQSDHESVFIASLHKDLVENSVSICLDQITDEVMINLANSWSRLGNGLFHSSIDRNLSIALDLAISQIVLPCVADEIGCLETLCKQLIKVLADRYPRSAAFTMALASYH
jgi:hypothetical protein